MLHRPPRVTLTDTLFPYPTIFRSNEGNVIFFCGAGISRRAGLPDFGGLTQKVVQKLGAEKALAAMERGDSSDRVFSLLVREFGQSEIDREIYAALKAAKDRKSTRLNSSH